MQFKILGSLSLAAIAILAFSGCAKTTYDGSPRVQPLATPLQQTTPPPASQDPTPPATPVVPVTPPPSGNLPVLSFVENEIVMNGKLEAQLEVQLSQASNLPVTAVIHLINATALHYRDYAGFKTRSSETSQTIVLPPGTTRMLLPVIGGRRTRFCDTHFFAVISGKRIQNARVVDDSARINLLCEFVQPAPVDQPPPTIPPIVVPVPVQPGAPCPMVQARFESEVIENRHHAKRSIVKVVLDRPSELPVIFDIETRDLTAFDRIDYIGMKVQLTIPPGDTSIELPIELINSQRCRTRDMHRWQQHWTFEFQAVVTGMTNANMNRPAALITYIKDVDDDNCLPAPPAAD